MKFLFNIDGSSEVSCIDVCSLALCLQKSTTHLGLFKISKLHERTNKKKFVIQFDVNPGQERNLKINAKNASIVDVHMFYRDERKKKEKPLLPELY